MVQQQRLRMASSAIATRFRAAAQLEAARRLRIAQGAYVIHKQEKLEAERPDTAQQIAANTTIKIPIFS